MVVRSFNAFETDTVEIRWTLADGTFYYERFTIPPKDVREARAREEADRPVFPDVKVERRAEPLTTLDATGVPLDGGRGKATVAVQQGPLTPPVHKPL